MGVGASVRERPLDGRNAARWNLITLHRRRRWGSVTVVALERVNSEQTWACSAA